MNISQIEFWRNQFIHWLEEHWIHDDKAHDIHHLHRVWRNCQKMMTEDRTAADPMVLLAAAYFHDLITLPKSHPERQQASWLSAEKTVQLLENAFPGFPREKMAGIHHAIHAHSFSANIPTNSPEAEILQDADRMEALGAMGIARLFYTAGMMKSSLYHSTDPSALHRMLDDTSYALDHIDAKLLKLPLTMKTIAGRRLAEKEAAFILEFKNKMLEEISAA